MAPLARGPHIGRMIPLSILDLAPVPEGSDVSQSLANTIDLARHAERLGYKRYWLAEHHNMPGIASAATSVVIGAVAAATTTIRVGAGGVMLPNHAPLVIAEQFGTLAALLSRPHRPGPGPRARLGPGARRGRCAARCSGDVDAFPQDVMELMQWFAPATPDQRIIASARRGPGRADLDPGLLDLRGAAGGPPGPALRLRQPFRARAR